MLRFSVATVEKRAAFRGALFLGGITMWTKESVFKEIKKIMLEDYAGNSAVVQTSIPKVTNQMSDEAFVRVVEDYLATFKDEHLYLSVKNSVRPNIGFRVRHHEDVLYIIEASQETRLHTGDKIIAIDGLSIEELSKKYALQLLHDKVERQKWNNVLMRARTITVEQRGVAMEMVLTTYARQRYQPTYAAKALTRETFYMKFTDFAQEYGVREILKTYEQEIAAAKHLIIDVRENYGGNDAFYFPLLDLVFDRDYTAKELQGKDTMFTNYTARNCALMMALLEDYIEPGMNQEIERMLDREMFLLEQHRGQGMIEVEEELDFTVEGKATPPAIYILTDYYCGSSGETFVAYAKKSPKVTIVGRPTMGIMATCNVLTVDFGDVSLNYSMSKINEDSELASKDGIQPHIYVPWTPAHLTKDVDMEIVRALIAEL